MIYPAKLETGGDAQQPTERTIFRPQFARGGVSDVLTGLAGRMEFVGSLRSAIHADPEGEWALALCNIDGFSHINDLVGHHAADMLLVTIAARLTGAFGGVAQIARVGGDEFALLFPRKTARAAAGLIRGHEADLRLALVLGGRVIEPSISVGIALCANPTHDEEMMRRAGAALRAAKRAARGTLVEFTPVMDGMLRSETAALSEARDALHEGRIAPFYQPKISLSDGRLVGFEALLRIRDVRGGFVGPSRLMRAFDDPETATMLGNRIQDCVFADMQRWRAAGLDFGRIAINASAAEFRGGQLGSRILAGMDAADLSPTLIEIEVTETVFVGARGQFVAEALCELHHAGARIALDDFGTGYASLCHLRDFPVDTIKIDQSFVRDIDSNPCSAAISEAVITVGRSLGIDVVAEGIETDGERELFERVGCPVGQGFLFGPPVAASAVPGEVRRFGAAH